MLYRANFIIANIHVSLAAFNIQNVPWLGPDEIRLTFEFPAFKLNRRSLLLLPPLLLFGFGSLIHVTDVAAQLRHQRAT